MGFRIGEEVVCIVPCWYGENPPYPILPGPKFREVCRIVGIVPGGRFGGQFLILAGYSSDDDFHSSGFRRVVKRSTDISFAHEILREATKPALPDVPEIDPAFETAMADAYPGYGADYVRRHLR